MKAYHITPNGNIKKFKLNSNNNGMGTSFYGYGLYFTRDRSVIDYYYGLMKETYDRLYLYTVEIDDLNVINENDELEDVLALELYADLVEETGSEVKATKEMLNLGYTGLTYESVEDGKSIVVYDSSIIEIVDMKALDD